MAKDSRPVAAFYFSNHPAPDRVRVGDGAYVRMEVIAEAFDISDALDRCQPRADESVMNTHYLRDNGRRTD